MKDFEIRVNEKDNYEKKNKKSIIINLTIGTILSVVVALKSDWTYGLGFVCFFFIVQFVKSNRWDKYYILSITINPAEIQLVYKEYNDEKTIKDSANFFEFKKKMAVSKSRIVYMAIYYKGNLLLEQSEEGDWNETKFNQVVDASKISPFAVD